MKALIIMFISLLVTTTINGFKLAFLSVNMDGENFTIEEAVKPFLAFNSYEIIKNRKYPIIAESDLVGKQIDYENFDIIFFSLQENEITALDQFNIPKFTLDKVGWNCETIGKSGWKDLTAESIALKQKTTVVHICFKNSLFNLEYILEAEEVITPKIAVGGCLSIKKQIASNLQDWYCFLGIYSYSNLEDGAGLIKNSVDRILTKHSMFYTFLLGDFKTRSLVRIKSIEEIHKIENEMNNRLHQQKMTDGIKKRRKYSEIPNLRNSEGAQSKGLRVNANNKLIKKKEKKTVRKEDSENTTDINGTKLHEVLKGDILATQYFKSLVLSNAKRNIDYLKNSNLYSLPVTYIYSLNKDKTYNLNYKRILTKRTTKKNNKINMIAHNIGWMDRLICISKDEKELNCDSITPSVSYFTMPCIMKGNHLPLIGFLKFNES